MKLREIIIKKYRYNNAAGGNQINVTVTVEKWNEQIVLYKEKSKSWTRKKDD